jgi:lysophospholipase L1-like esterase
VSALHLLKLLLALASFCLALLLGELTVRYLLQAPPFERALVVPSHLTARDAPLRWRYSASNGRNSLGLRNREVGPKAIGSCRILFLGDSLVDWGNTSSGDLYTQVLERDLNSRFSHGEPRIETINAGVPGYTTYQELQFLKIYGLDMRPDYVVLGFVLNDLFPEYEHKPTSQDVLDREPTRYLYSFNPGVFPGELFARSYLAHELVRRSAIVWKRLLRRPTFPFEENSAAYLAWKDYGWINARRLIGEMQRLLSEHNVPLTIIVFPIREQVDDKYRRLDEAYVLYPQGRIREISEAYRIPMLDLTEPLHTNGGEKLFRDYVHLTPNGNDVVARELEKYMVDRLTNLPSFDAVHGCS